MTFMTIKRTLLGVNLTTLGIKTSVTNTTPNVTFMILHLVRFVFVRLVLPLISTVPGFDQSPSEDERFHQRQLHSPGMYLINSLPFTELIAS